ncbi:hypothetical protein [Bacillus sp. B1-b2]|uniref:hypothetical protein n=1 Tax=Bacillus sp. B1-b2 TaxID=2653201 RepID=UPI0012629598|nr:hypothetical protein [Bacillus sp. B1-b2]KAB7666446.1 hypothetical protein F9279_17515 [Bacillus sp. B1-b2]
MKKLVWSFLAVLLITSVQVTATDAAVLSNTKEEVKTLAISEQSSNNVFQIRKIVPPIPQA